MFINLNTGGFKEWLKKVDTELYENCKAVSILSRTKTHIRRIIDREGELLLINVCTIKRDLYELEQNFIEENE